MKKIVEGVGGEESKCVERRILEFKEEMEGKEEEKVKEI